jgi:N-acetylglucosaminyldiphosphoundecaprenol N-acetyl-beta-D-mannosaminyltransferase
MGSDASAADPLVDLLGVRFVPWTEAEVVAHVATTLAGPAPRGGWIVTPNVDVLRRIVGSAEVAELVAPATLTVADGMPLVWASRVQRTPLPERVTGASLIGSLCAAVAGAGRTAYLLGGEEGAAEAAAVRLVEQYPGLHADGWSPPFGIEATDDGRAEIVRRVAAADPDLVFCGFGFPKQERVISWLAPQFPDAWFVGCGAAITFTAGRISRAPAWMQRTGLEWVHRLVNEPRRLFRRYVIEDAPFALRLLWASARKRRQR